MTVSIKNNFEQSQNYFNKALNKHKRGDFAAAENLYKRALRHNVQHLDANYLLGTLYAEHGNLVSALKFLGVCGGYKFAIASGAKQSRQYLSNVEAIR